MMDIVNNNSIAEGRKWSRLPKFTDEERELNKGMFCSRLRNISIYLQKNDQIIFII